MNNETVVVGIPLMVIPHLTSLKSVEFQSTIPKFKKEMKKLNITVELIIAC